ncbi:MAG TPA: GH92 family glycosyl hydrolase [Rhizomicrobium sp.]|nr:GH92 family glycosyl hydrolase [Rhizomicrobium sp.]
MPVFANRKCRLILAIALASMIPGAGMVFAADYAGEVNPFIGSTNGGNTYPGATLPFGMVAFSPEETPLPGRGYPIAAPGGYEWRANGIKGFSLTHLSGTGCTGASGDIPVMPVTMPVDTSPSADDSFTKYASWFNHDREQASPGFYKVALGNGVTVELSATLRSGIARFSWPKDKVNANLLFRTSDSEVGSSDAAVTVYPEKREVTGSVTSGNFCGYLSPDRRESYYTLHFIAKFDAPFTEGGAWHDLALMKGARAAQGGTTYGERGHPPGRKGSGAWISFDPAKTPVVEMRVGISYVSLANARANLSAEQRNGTTLESARDTAREIWNRRLGAIAIAGGRKDERTVFYTALYHALLEPNTYSDVNGEYRGFDTKVHKVAAPRRVQYANFSGWDVYRSQLQLLTWLNPELGSDIAQSLYNQAKQNNGVWDRWTHLTGATSVMNGDPSAAAVASIYAFGGRDFDVKGAYASLLKAATVANPLDLSRRGCPVQCVGERPGLDQWLKLHYMPVGAPGWGSAADTLEMTSADFALSQLAVALGDKANETLFLDRAGWWRNLFNPHATPEGGYIQPRNADGSWKTVDFNADDDDDYVEGSGAQYLWMVPYDPAGLFAALGGIDRARARLDHFFYNADGSLAVTKSGSAHAELDNEPSIASPWLYDFDGAPSKTQEVVRAAIKQIWKNAPDGISGNDDLGEMSSWLVWAALGMYPLYPGRSEFVLGSPLFEQAIVNRPGQRAIINAKGAAIDAPFIDSMSINGVASTKPWLPASFAMKGGTLEYVLARTPNKNWGAALQDAPPSFGPKQGRAQP